jgi:hypothetical protein
VVLPPDAQDFSEAPLVEHLQPLELRLRLFQIHALPSSAAGSPPTSPGSSSPSARH